MVKIADFLLSDELKNEREFALAFIGREFGCAPARPS